jgi:hypothetical protein
MLKAQVRLNSRRGLLVAVVVAAAAAASFFGHSFHPLGFFDG